MTYGSLFTGIGGFDLGFDKAGMRCLWQCEIEPNARRVLETHWPDVKKFKDVRKVGKHNAKRVDVICGGFPCQDLSVAGKRAGLDGERSGLWFEFRRIVEELTPSWVVIENVPGLLSSESGRDLAVVFRGLEELGYWWAYRTLDAQYDGVAQRRRRVFIVASLGNARCAEVLFESESLSWDTEPRRETWESVAASLTRGSSSPGTNPPGRRQEDDVNIVLAPTVSGTLGSHKTGGFGGSDLDTCGAHIVTSSPLTTSPYADRGDGLDNLIHDISSTILSGPHGYAPEPGSGIIVTPINTQNALRGGKMGEGTGFGIGEEGDPAYTISTNHSHAVAIRTAQSNSNGHGLADDVAHTIDLANGQALAVQTGQPLAFNSKGSAHQGLSCGQMSPTLDKSKTPSVIMTTGVRRLTPTECARLQGFPDDHCLMLSDSAQYRAYGNAVCAKVAFWIGTRLHAYHRLSKKINYHDLL